MAAVNGIFKFKHTCEIEFNISIFSKPKNFQLFDLKIVILFFFDFNSSKILEICKNKMTVERDEKLCRVFGGEYGIPAAALTKIVSDDSVMAKILWNKQALVFEFFRKKIDAVFLLGMSGL